MASGNIKGITIEFRGDTTSLDKALRKISDETRKIDRELKNVDRALKFNPTNVELWRQKQSLLNQKLKETNEKTKLLKDTLKKVDSGEIELSASETDRLKRELIEAESKAKTLKTQIRQIGNVNLKATSEQFKQWGSKLEDAGRAMQGLSVAAGAVAASIGALAVKSGKWADDLNTMSKRYSIGTGDLQKYAAAADLVDVSVETIAKSHTKLEKQMLSARNGSKNTVAAFDALGVAYQNADGSLRSSDEVFSDVISALGKMENETERDAYAMQLMGKSASELNPLIEDNGETYKRVADTFSKYGLDYIDQETLDKANEFNDQLDTIKAIGLVTFQTIGAQLAGYLAPALEKVVEWVGKLSNWLSQLSPEVLAIIGIVATAVATIAPLLIVLGKLATGIGSIINLANMMGTTVGALASPIGIAIAAIAAIVAIGIVLYKNWDKIKAKAIELKTKIITTFAQLKANVVSTFNNIKNAIVTPIQNAIDKVKGIIQRIKGFFPIKVGNIFGHIKLPHFKLSGKLSLNPPSIPKLSVDWYKTGGIFDSPSVIGVGEAGSEAVVPLDKFWDKLDKLHGETNIVININGADGNAKEIAQEVKRMLIQETNRQRLAWT